MSDDEQLKTHLPLPPRVAEIREANRQFFVTCRQRLLNSFTSDIIEKIESRDKTSELNELVEDCFRARHGAYILGAEGVTQADDNLFTFLDSICFNKFSVSALSSTIQYFYANFQWQDSPLALRAEKAAASAEAHR